MILGIFGSEDANGLFHVIDICYCNPSPQKPLSICEKEPVWIAFVSGLHFGSVASGGMSIQLLMDFLTGEADTFMVHSMLTQDADESRAIVRLVICGNSVSPPNKEDKVKNKFGIEECPFDPLPIQACDEWISAICSTMDVDLLPGDKDPSSQLFPQQSMHRSMYSKSSTYSSFHSVTNPYLFETEETQFDQLNLDAWRRQDRI